MVYPDYANLRLDRPAERILRITLSRGPMNAFDYRMHNDLSEIWPLIDKDREINAVILTGAGHAFSAGQDFTDIERMVSGDFDFLALMMKEGLRLVRNMTNFSKPVVAAINGPAAGGGLAAALMSDVTIASRTAKLVDGHTRLGVAAGDHAALIWPLLCGMAKAKYYLLTCDALTGEEAERIGLVSMCVDSEALEAKALEVASKLARSAPSAVRWTKQALNTWLRNAAPNFEVSMALEILGMMGPEAQEGLAAHLERRPPRFPLDSAA
jgi:enoyl-CoA hydratase